MEYGLFTSAGSNPPSLQMQGADLGDETERRGVRLRTIVSGIEVVMMDVNQRGGAAFANAGMAVSDVITAVDGQSCVGKGCLFVFWLITARNNQAGAALIEAVRKVPSFPTARRLQLSFSLPRECFRMDVGDLPPQEYVEDIGSLPWEGAQRAQEVRNEATSGYGPKSTSHPSESAWFAVNSISSRESSIINLLTKQMQTANKMLYDEEEDGYVDEKMKGDAQGNLAYKVAVEFMDSVNNNRKELRTWRRENLLLRQELAALNKKFADAEGQMAYAKGVIQDRALGKLALLASKARREKLLDRGTEFSDRLRQLKTEMQLANQAKEFQVLQMLEARSEEYAEELSSMRKHIDDIKSDHVEEINSLKRRHESEARDMKLKYDVEMENLVTENKRAYHAMLMEKETLIVQLKNQRDLINQKLGIALDEAEDGRHREAVTSSIHIEARQSVADMQLAMEALRKVEERNQRVIQEQQAQIESLQRKLDQASEINRQCLQREEEWKEHWRRIGRDNRRTIEKLQAGLENSINERTEQMKQMETRIQVDQEAWQRSRDALSAQLQKTREEILNHVSSTSKRLGKAKLMAQRTKPAVKEWNTQGGRTPGTHLPDSRPRPESAEQNVQAPNSNALSAEDLDNLLLGLDEQVDVANALEQLIKIQKEMQEENDNLLLGFGWRSLKIHKLYFELSLARTRYEAELGAIKEKFLGNQIQALQGRPYQPPPINFDKEEQEEQRTKQENQAWAVKSR